MSGNNQVPPGATPAFVLKSPLQQEAEKNARDAAMMNQIQMWRMNVASQLMGPLLAKKYEHLAQLAAREADVTGGIPEDGLVFSMEEAVAESARIARCGADRLLQELRLPTISFEQQEAPEDPEAKVTSDRLELP